MGDGAASEMGLPLYKGQNFNVDPPPLMMGEWLMVGEELMVGEWLMV